MNDTALYNLACTYSLWGKIDLAIEKLRLAAKAGFDDVSHMETDPDLEPLHSDLRYQDLIDSLKKKKGMKDRGA